MSYSPQNVAGKFADMTSMERVQVVQQMMREVTRSTDPQEMVRAYGTWLRSITPTDRFISLSRRDLASPWYRVTRSGLWEEQGKTINPWRDKHLLPMANEGALGELIYNGNAVIDNDWKVSESDPMYEHIGGFRSMRCVPMYENGISMNMVVHLFRQPGHFDDSTLADAVWLSNLFGRATYNLVLADELRRANDALEAEMRTVADIQRSLLPAELPKVEGLELAAYYQTSRNAGGDYYDFFELPEGKLGILIADVSGHGTPAAVMMAVTHSIAHTREGPPDPPSQLLEFINKRLCARYTNNGTFVTAFYGIYDPADRSILYCSAGHNPPIVRSAGSSECVLLDGNHNLPLGIESDEQFEDARAVLSSGDTLVIYTDGIVEARKPGSSDLLGLDAMIAVACACDESAQVVVDRITKLVNEFTDGALPADDQTLVVVKVK